jgi:hypothetical protein
MYLYSYEFYFENVSSVLKYHRVSATPVLLGKRIDYSTVICDTNWRFNQLSQFYIS